MNSYQHMVHLTSGDNQGHNLMIKAPIKAAEVFEAGAALVLDTTNTFRAADSASDADEIIMWAENGAADNDVTDGLGSNQEYNFNDTDTVSIGAYPATGGYEMKTTEYVADTYAVGNKLMVGTGANIGKLINQTGILGTTGFVGVVTRETKNDRKYNIDTLQFLSVYFPGHAHV